MDRTVAANHWRRIGAPHHNQAQALVNAHPPIPQRGSNSTPLPRYTTPGDEMGGTASSLEKKKSNRERPTSAFSHDKLLPATHAFNPQCVLRPPGFHDRMTASYSCSMRHCVRSVRGFLCLYECM